MTVKISARAWPDQYNTTRRLIKMKRPATSFDFIRRPSSALPLSMPVNMAYRGRTQTRTAKANLERAVNAAFATPSELKYGVVEKAFMFWYTCTTTLTAEQIVQLWVAAYQNKEKSRTLDVATLSDILRRLFDRAAQNNGLLGDYKLTKPQEDGWCVCDFGMQCTPFKRKGNSAKDKQLAILALGVWQGPYRELLRCPHGYDAPKISSQETSALQERIDVRGRLRTGLNGFWSFLLRALRASWRGLQNAVIVSWRRICSLARPSITVLVWFVVLDWFYTPTAELSVHSFIWRDFCTTWYGIASVIALVHTSLKMLPGSSPVEPSVDALQDEIADVGLVISQVVARSVEVFIQKLTAVSVAMYICSRTGLIEHWRMATYPGDLGQPADEPGALPRIRLDNGSLSAFVDHMCQFWRVELSTAPKSIVG